MVVKQKKKIRLESEGDSMRFFDKIFKKSSTVDEEENQPEFSVTTEEFFSRLRMAQKREDYLEQAELYYQIGFFYYEEGDKERARLYFGRSNSLINSQDEVYESISAKIRHQCEEYIEKLDEESLLTNCILDEIEEKAKKMTEHQKCQWIMLTMARVKSLLESFSYVRGCEIFNNFDKIFYIAKKALYESERLTQNNLDSMNLFASDLYEFMDSPAFVSYRSCVAVPNYIGKEIELYDFNGFDAMLNLHLFFSYYAELLEDGFEDSKVRIPVEFVAGAMLTDYYLRTGKGRIESQKEVQKEIECIRFDYEFLMKNPAREQYEAKLKSYQESGF